MYNTTIAIDDFDKYLENFPQDAEIIDKIEEIVFNISYEVSKGGNIFADEITGWSSNITEILLKSGIRCYIKETGTELAEDIENWLSEAEIEAKLWEAYDKERKDKEEYRASVEYDFIG